MFNQHTSIMVNMYNMNYNHHHFGLFNSIHVHSVQLCLTGLNCFFRIDHNVLNWVIHDQKVFPYYKAGISFKGTSYTCVLCLKYANAMISTITHTQMTPNCCIVLYDRNYDISMREAITKLENCITEIGQHTPV